MTAEVLDTSGAGTPKPEIPDAAGADTRHPWLAHYPDDIDWHAPIPPTTLVDFWDRAAGQYAGHRAIDFLGKGYTYGALARQVDAMAAGLQRLGVGKGTRVGLFLPNCPYFVVAYFAVLKAGGIVVNINPLYAEQEIAHLIGDSGCTVAVTLDLVALYPKLALMLDRTGLQRIVVCPMAPSLPFPKNLLFPLAKRKEIARIPRDARHVRFAELVAGAARPEPVAVAPEDTAVLQYTGGTTGTPKGAMLSHANITANIEQSRLWFTTAEPGRERMMAVLPFFHVFAMTVIMGLSIRLGAQIILLPRFELDGLLQAISTKKPTLFPAVPTIYTAINTHPKLSTYDLTSIKACLSGGAPLPLEVKQRFEQITGCALAEGYGLTESAPVACCNPLTGLSKAGSIGLPVPGTRVEIVSLDDGETVMPRGERGEVCLRGPQVMAGYWNAPAETAATLRNGRLHTGDVGYMDEDGYVFLVDRIKDIILCAGYNVYPRTVEEAIYQHPAVEEVIVAGVPDPYRGETVKAFIKLRDGAALDEAGLTAFLADKLSPMEQPKQVAFRDTPLPKTMIGKLSRKDMLKQDAAEAGR